MRKTGRKPYNTTPHANPEAVLHNDQPDRHHTSTQQAEAKDRSHRTNNHAGPRAAPRLAEDEHASAKTTPTLHRSRAKQHHRVSTNAESSKDKAASIETSSPT